MLAEQQMKKEYSSMYISNFRHHIKKLVEILVYIVQIYPSQIATKTAVRKLSVRVLYPALVGIHTLATCTAVCKFLVRILLLFSPLRTDRSICRVQH